MTDKSFWKLRFCTFPTPCSIPRGILECPQQCPELSPLPKELPSGMLQNPAATGIFKQPRKFLRKLSIQEFPLIFLCCRNLSRAPDLPDLGTLLLWELLAVPRAPPSSFQLEGETGQAGSILMGFQLHGIDGTAPNSGFGVVLMMQELFICTWIREQALPRKRQRHFY